MTLRVLHTSDWHIGHVLYGKKRHEEYEKFLKWLTDLIKIKEIDLLLISGDVFDTTTPGNRARELYYGFLKDVAALGDRHVIITGGNHDSPTLLEAPSGLLKLLKVNVIGAAPDNPEDEVIVVEKEGEVPIIVCAVPFLRERDIRRSGEDESPEEKRDRVAEGIAEHYSKVTEAALRKREELGCNAPIIAMGHLFTQRGRTVEDDGVRDRIYVGNLGHVGHGDFPKEIDYLALGHLHLPQLISKSETRRYSGSPLPIGFGEASTEKKVVLIETEEGCLCVEDVTVPVFHRLEEVRGDAAEIKSRLQKLKGDNEEVWVEIKYTGGEIVPGLGGKFDDLTEGSKVEILCFKNETKKANLSAHGEKAVDIKNLSVEDVFNMTLQKAFDEALVKSSPELEQALEKERAGLEELFREIVIEMETEDRMAE